MRASLQTAKWVLQIEVVAWITTQLVGQRALLFAVIIMSKWLTLFEKIEVQLNWPRFRAVALINSALPPSAQKSARASHVSLQ